MTKEQDNILNKDWTGNKNSIYKTLGASNHTEKEREENDFYATEPKAVELLCQLEKFDKNIWENACGEGHLSNELIKQGYNVYSSDLIDRGYGEGNVNFLEYNNSWNGDIITNPPYKFAKEFIEKSIEIIPDGNKVAMFLKIQFLEGKARKVLFKKYPPKIIYVSSSRLLCAKNADFKSMKEGGGSAVAYAWFVWQKGFNGKTTIEWFN
jgi:hypothetical protein